MLDLGRFPYIDGTNGVIEIDNDAVYTVNANTSVRYQGKTLAIGIAQSTALIGTGLEIDEGDRVEVDGDVITILESAKLTADAAALQALVDAVKTKADAGTLAIADLTAAGVTGTVAGNLAAYQTAIAGKAAADVNTVAKLQAVVDAVNVAEAAAALQALVDAVKTKADAGTLAIADLTAAGVTGTVAGNLAAYQTAIAGKAAADVNTVAKLQALVNDVNTVEAAAAAEVIAVAAVNASNDKFDLRTAVNNNLVALGMSAIDLDQADYLFTKAPGIAGALAYADAAAIRAELANY